MVQFILINLQNKCHEMHIAMWVDHWGQDKNSCFQSCRACYRLCAYTQRG